MQIHELISIVPRNQHIKEGKMKDLDYDLRNMKPSEFKSKYGMTKKDLLNKMKPSKNANK